MEKINLLVENNDNYRLDKVIVLNMEELSRTQIQEMIGRGLILVNGKVEKASYKTKLDDQIEIIFEDNSDLEIEAEDIPLNIVYEDKDVIVVDKPTGMIVHPSPGITSGTLVNALLFHCKDLSGINGVNRPGIVHRIDKETSGLLMVAKNDLAHRFLSRTIEGA